VGATQVAGDWLFEERSISRVELKDDNIAKEEEEASAKLIEEAIDVWNHST